MRCFGLLSLLLFTTVLGAEAPDYDIQLDIISQGFDKKTCWVHPRAGTIPTEPPKVVLTTQKLLLSGSDIFLCPKRVSYGRWGG